MSSHPVDQFVGSLVERWRDEESLLRKRGISESAALMESMADELAAEANRWLDTMMTLREAAEIAGLSYTKIQHMVRAGVIRNAGEKGRPRVLRRDLPWQAKEGGPSGPHEVVWEFVSELSGDEPELDLVRDELLAMERSPVDPDPAWAHGLRSDDE